MSASESGKSLKLLATLSFGLTAIAYGLSLGVTFISEDWIHVLVAQHILSGDTALLVDSFTRPWLQTSRVGVFYRPLIDLTFLWDVFVRHLLQIVSGQPSAEFVPIFRLTNLILHGLTSFLVGLITFILTKRAGGLRANSAALTAAALTAANPLSVETLLWIICRCDGLSTCLSLASLALFLLSFEQLNKRKIYLCLSLGSFLMAMLAKETAFVLPLIVLLAWLFFYRQDKSGLRLCALYIALLAFFLPLRALAIGGLGGYQASMGELLDGGMLSHFFNLQDWLHLAYPYNQAYYSWANFQLPLIYSIMYVIFALGLIIGAGKETIDRRLLVFSALAFVFTLLPARQVFMLLPTLFGARTLYLPECFLAMALAYTLSQFRSQLFAKVWTGLFVSLLIVTSNLNIQVFRLYSGTMQGLIERINQYCRQNPSALISLANLPFNYKVGSIVGEVWQMRTACTGTMGDINSRRLVTGAVAYHPHPDLFNKARALSQCKNMGAALLSVLPGAQQNEFTYVSPDTIQSWQNPLQLTFNGRQFKAMPTRVLNLQFDNSVSAGSFQGADFAEILVRKKDAPVVTKEQAIKTVEALPRFYALPEDEDRLTFLWHTDYGDLIYPNTTLTAPLDKKSALVLYRFPLADKFSFKCATMLKDLAVIGVPDGYELATVCLRDGKSFIPELEPRSLQQEEDLIYGAVSTKGEAIEFFYDLTAIPDADSALVEFTRPDAAFIHTTGTLMEATPRTASILSWKQEGLRGTVKIDTSKMPTRGRYQVRVLALDASGKTKGYFSFPRDIVYNPEGFGPIDKPEIIDFQRLIFDTRPDKN